MCSLTSGKRTHWLLIHTAPSRSILFFSFPTNLMVRSLNFWKVDEDSRKKRASFPLDLDRPFRVLGDMRTNNLDTPFCRADRSHKPFIQPDIHHLGTRLGLVWGNTEGKHPYPPYYQVDEFYTFEMVACKLDLVLRSQMSDVGNLGGSEKFLLYLLGNTLKIYIKIL